MDKQLSIRVVQAFVGATVEVFSQMCRTEVKAGTPYLEETNNRMYGISGIMRTTGDLDAIVVLTMPNQPAVNAVNAMAGSSFESITGMVMDGIREITGIIVGGAKKRLDLHGMKVDLGLPKVVVGTNYTNHHGYCSRVVVIPFESQLGRFILDISFKREGDPAARTSNRLKALT